MYFLDVQSEAIIFTSCSEIEAMLLIHMHDVTRYLLQPLLLTIRGSKHLKIWGQIHISVFTRGFLIYKWEQFRKNSWKCVEMLGKQVNVLQNYFI
jgi:hypothetical protein